MRWIAKAAAHWALSTMPGGGELRYRIQRRLGSTNSSFNAAIESARAHLEAVTSLSPLTADAHYFEFGAGCDLIQPLIFWASGVRTQTIIDIKPLARLELVNEAISQIRKLGYDLPPSVGSFDELRQLGIDYQAPQDARAPVLPASSVRYMSNTNTLEHIPGRDIPAILGSCRRMLSYDGAFSLRIDYADHYSYADSTITPVNFLRYRKRAWSAFNPPTHYQNRLRHREYLKMIREADFAVVDERRIEEPALQNIHVNGYSREDIVTIASYMLLKKRDGASI